MPHASNVKCNINGREHVLQAGDSTVCKVNATRPQHKDWHDGEDDGAHGHGEEELETDWEAVALHMVLLEVDGDTRAGKNEERDKFE